MDCVAYTDSLSSSCPNASSRKLRPSKSSSKSLSSLALFAPFIPGAFEELVDPLPSDPRSFSSTSNGSAVSGTVVDCLRPDPLGLREEANKDVVDSLEANEREDDRGLKPGL